MEHNPACVGGAVFAATLDRLAAHGFHLRQARMDDACTQCGCRLGDHHARLPADTTNDNLFERVGWIECERCVRNCGTWTATPAS